MDCELDGQACRALVDTGSPSSVRGVLWGTKGVLSAAWTPTAVQMRMVTGERTSMEGIKSVHIHVGGWEMVYEVWLAHMQDPCNIGRELDNINKNIVATTGVCPCPRVHPPGPVQFRGAAEDGL